MALWLQGLVFVTEKANYQKPKRIPICFFFPTWFLLGQKTSRQHEVTVWRREKNFHFLSHFKLLFFAFSLCTPCIQWYLWLISDTKPLSIPITWFFFASALSVYNEMLHTDGCDYPKDRLIHAAKYRCIFNYRSNKQEQDMLKTRLKCLPQTDFQCAC